MQSTLERPPEQSREEWLKERRTYLGGTDAAAILGLNPYKSPLEVWLEKKGLVESTDNPRMRFGRRFEPFVAEDYCELTGLCVVEGGTVRHPRHEFLGGNPDRLVDGQPGIVELKTGGLNTARDWGEPWTDQVPKHYLVQGVYYLYLTNRDWCDFAFYNRDTCETSVYRVRRDMELEVTIVARCVEWWERHIEADVQPPADGSDSASEFINKAFPRDSGVVVAATPEIDDMVDELRRLKLEANGLYKEAKALENAIKQFMGEAAVMRTSLGDLTWKNNAPSRSTDFDSALCSFRLKAAALLGDPGHPVLKALDEEIEAFTALKPGPRVFRVPGMRS